MPTSDPPSSPEHGRELFRVTYPPADRPRLALEDGTEARVMDCSERGLRCRVAPGLWPPAFGTLVAGRVEFRAAAPVAIVGRVIRVDEGEVALRLSPPGLPLRTIFTEQRALRARYPFHDADAGPAQ